MAESDRRMNLKGLSRILRNFGRGSACLLACLLACTDKDFFMLIVPFADCCMNPDFQDFMITGILNR